MRALYSFDFSFYSLSTIFICLSFPFLTTLLPAQISYPSITHLDSLWTEIENPATPLAERLKTWAIYADETSVYHTVYGHKAKVDKKALLDNFSLNTAKKEYHSQILIQYLYGEYYWKKGHANKALQFFRQMEILRKEQIPNYPTKILYHYLSILYGETGKPVTAIDYAKKCLDACKDNDERLKGITYWNIGILYGNLERYEKEQAYLNLAKSIAYKLDYQHLKANVLSALCNNEEHSNRVRYADSLYQATIAFCEKNNLVYEKYATLLNFGIFKMNVYPLEAAQKDFLVCAQYFEAIQNDFWSSAAAAQLGNVYLRTNHLDKAITHLERAYTMQNSLGLAKEKSKTAYTIYEYYKKRGNAEMALEHLEIAKILNDSITSEANQVKIAQIEHEMKQKHQEEMHLEKMNNQQNLYQEQVKRKNVILLALSLGLLLLGISLLLAFFGYQNKQKANKKIKQQKLELEQLNIAKDRIISVLAHDLQKPMLSFRGIGKKVKYLLDKQHYERLVTLGGALDKEVNTLSALLDNLLKWALLQKDSLHQHTKEVAVRPVVNQIINLFENTANQKSIKLIPTINPKHKVLADNHLLATIIRNLVDNAIKFTEPNGEVIISSKIVGKEVLISVQDSGIGIPADKLNRIFLLQKEKSNIGTLGERGSGLGLYLVKELTTLCKGKIKVSSQIGEGTSFFIHLPLC